jgi:hypothetical protein
VASSPPQPALRTTEEGTEDDDAGVRITREAGEAPLGQPKSRGSQKPRQDPEDPSDDEDSSSESDEDVDDDDHDDGHDDDHDDDDVDSDDDGPIRERTKSFSPAVGTDISSYSKECIKYAYNRFRRSAGSAGKGVKQLIGPATYQHWKENILDLLGIEGLMPVIDGTCQKPPRGHKLRFKWDTINMRAGQVLLATVSEPINQDLARHFQRPRYVWKQLNSLYSELHIMRDGYKAAIQARISECPNVADYVYRIESAWRDINIGHQWTEETERHQCWSLLLGLDTPVWKDWESKFLADAERKSKRKAFCFRKMARKLQLAEERSLELLKCSQPRPSMALTEARRTTVDAPTVEKKVIELTSAGRSIHTSHQHVLRVQAKKRRR